MIAIKLTQVGNSVGAVFPKEALNELGVTKGDTLYLTKGPDGSMRVTAYDDEVRRQIELGEQLMDQNRDVFRALAK
ncbi:MULTISPECIES: AbrB/MazE/SpoVT family DNA-binding domain-containing protein [Brevundimonas]|jgi:putative addiction module antidote|uniref:Putative addiction module antidote n=1 Tax=Brevundimonas halotolerans TaxID=69670 RepID=A0A7W9A1G0_9CAUL|nr:MULTISPECIES: AbrB/MazE/SpoVT family DNA-binding domain-containing protein [Brevundimonas]MAL87580.1 AbrB/MazE/SpoVT family DNA-binding domain-containing protein [Brevundimonas sp.]MBB5659626.1 putative addiction module antidote [Brevundimonas halotolerans]HAJ02155.1 AbrB/MazE/SpoVT family DNA-binding domain-containing protein [Brevundimonas sp.]HAV51164.1 AbrB/MazE/SpoVT family DNA-binding domain-containing protein [Brevundimonas sp.]|tara:strand:+ start:4224 stop:4451 length:228 start_codon:yes stop_codon:yes gene_type:complete